MRRYRHVTAAPCRGRPTPGMLDRRERERWTPEMLHPAVAGAGKLRELVALPGDG